MNVWSLGGCWRSQNICKQRKRFKTLLRLLSYSQTLDLSHATQVWLCFLSYEIRNKVQYVEFFQGEWRAVRNYMNLSTLFSINNSLKMKTKKYLQGTLSLAWSRLDSGQLRSKNKADTHFDTSFIMSNNKFP